MNAEYWRRLNTVFHEALALAPEAREAFLDEACRGDEPMKAEVVSLLAAHAGTSVLDRPAYEAVPELFADTDGELVGRRLGPYRVIRILGRGGMGVVYLAEDTRLDRPVAIKTVPARVVHDERLRQRLRREAVTAASLSHPGIATVHALEEIESRLYLVREYVKGRTIREVLASGPLPMATVLSIAGNVARALTAAHARGVIHRDLKPENVMRTEAGAIKVLDFGLARVGRSDAEGSRERLTTGGSVIGTTGYMSPEQLRGGAIDFRTDHFSFGVLLYELVSGRHPFDDGDPVSTLARVLESDAAAMTTWRPACPPGLERIVRVCLSRNPEDRYPTTEALAADLEAVAAGEQVPTAGAGVSERERAEPVTADSSARWWWQFHQLAVSAWYVGMLYPLWLVRGSAPDGLGVPGFIVSVIVAGVTANLRLHLWFTSRFYPGELVAQRRRALFWTRTADAAMAIVLLAAGLVTIDERGTAAAGLVAAAITVVMVSRVVEPATTRAAFPRP